MNYVVVAIPFFILAMIVEFAYGALVKRQTYRLSDTVNSLQLGTLSRAMDLLHLSFATLVFGAFVQWLSIPQWSMQPFWHWIVAFVVYDFCYYWKHRFGHEWRIMWASHVAHHQSEEFNLSTALRQTGTDYIGFVFYIPMFLIGVPPAAVVTVGSLNLIYQFWVHTEHVRRIGPLEWVLVSPSNHRVHHARNPEYLDKNYGGVFIVWDRMFGTFKDERPDVPCEYGITTGLHSWNPIWANVHFWWDTAKLAWATKNIGDKFKIWFKPPAWVPPDVEVPHKELANSKFDPPTDLFTRIYIFVQLWVVTFASLWVLETESKLPRWLVLSAFVWIVSSFYVQGVWLEGRTYASRLEWVRIAASLALAGIVAQVWAADSLAGPFAVGLGAYALASGLVVGIRGLTLTPRPQFS